MIVLNPKLLAQFRGPGCCENCGKPCSNREAHHLWPRGRGFQLDIRINLMAVGAGFECPCHTERHNSGEHKSDMLAKVAAREDTFQHHIGEVIHLFNRLPKWPRPWQIEDELKQMGASRALAMRVLRECDLVFEE